MGYMVITSQAPRRLRDVRLGRRADYNIVDATAWKHDPMKRPEGGDCQRRASSFGFYYSQAWDWGEPDGAGNDWDYDQPGGDKQLHGGQDLVGSPRPELVATTREIRRQQSDPADPRADRQV